MITTGYVRKMAAYNRWMNETIYAACEQLSDADRKTDRGAFFGSIHATLNHILWADQMWMHRLTGSEKPKASGITGSLEQHADFDDLKRERAAFDAMIEDWAASLDPAWLEGELNWHSGSTGRDMASPRWILVTHMFNHQTHHRGQVHCLLTQFGMETPVTDLPFAP